LEYCIVEPSAQRRKWQQKVLGDFVDRIRWATHLSQVSENPASPVGRPPPAGICGIIFSNELLDAMPVHRLGWDAGRREWFEWGVTVRDGKLAWAKVESPESGLPNLKSGRRKSKVQSQPYASRFTFPELPEALLKVLPDGFTTEICPAAAEWWGEAARRLRRGRLMTIDYGLGAEEFFAPERNEGTLRAYYRHRLSKELLVNPGGQDITAHVNFTAIQSAGEAAGLTTEQFVTQAAFLSRLAARFWQTQENREQWSPARARQFQTLTHPEHLGARFRVLVQSRR
jgi:SAM-dependent MidA family methyltransferase